MFKAYDPGEETIILNFGGTHDAAVGALVVPDDVPEYAELKAPREARQEGKVLVLTKEFEIDAEPSLEFRYGT